METLLIIITILITYYLAQYTHFNSKCYIFEHRYELYSTLLTKLKRFSLLSCSLESRVMMSKEMIFDDEEEDLTYFEENAASSNQLFELYDDICIICNKAKFIFTNTTINKYINALQIHTLTISDYLDHTGWPGKITIYDDIGSNVPSSMKAEFIKAKKLLHEFLLDNQIMTSLTSEIKLPTMPTEWLCQKLKSLLGFN